MKAEGVHPALAVGDTLTPAHEASDEIDPNDIVVVHASLPRRDSQIVIELDEEGREVNILESGAGIKAATLQMDVGDSSVQVGQPKAPETKPAVAKAEGLQSFHKNTSAIPDFDEDFDTNDIVARFNTDMDGDRRNVRFDSLFDAFNVTQYGILQSFIVLDAVEDKKLPQKVPARSDILNDISNHEVVAPAKEMKEEVKEEAKPTILKVENASNEEGQYSPSLDIPVPMDIDHAPQMRRLPGQRQRARLVMDGIELPTLASLGWRRTRSPSTPSSGRSSLSLLTPLPDEGTSAFIKLEEIRLTEADLRRLQELDNPDIKIKESFMANESIVARLHAIGMDRWPISLPPHKQAYTVDRRWMSKEYGGNSQDTFPPIDREKFTHGIYFAYLNFDYNPHAPKHPGDPGLFFATGWWDDESNLNFTLFVKLGVNRWQYMGKYSLFRAVPLTKDEWNGQSDAFKDHWANNIMNKEWGLKTRARVFLRKHLHREPTPEEFEERMHSGQPMNVSADDIKRDFSSGRQIMCVYSMKCIGYDNEFQEALAKMPPDWEPEKSTKNDDNGKKRKRKKRKTKKRNTDDDRKTKKARS